MSRILLPLLLAAVVMTGCVSQPPPIKPVTLYDLDTAAQMLVKRMLAHPQFLANLNAAKAAKGNARLLAVLGNIGNNTTLRIQPTLDAAGEVVRAELFNSGMMDVKDDDRMADAIQSRIVHSPDRGLETSELVQITGTHEVPDFLVLGDCRAGLVIDGHQTYRLRLSVHNIKTGKIVWEGIQMRVKL